MADPLLTLAALPRSISVISQEYRTNRPRFPQDELAQYVASWVAFSADGCRIVARGETVERLEEEMAAAGEDPQRVVLEWIPGPDEDTQLGAGEWA
jgi:hypothetical protein